MKKFNKSLKNFFPALMVKKQKGFTLAEILLSLTVIGIVAAIALPSLLGNANERAWETQKKALYTRFSQALPLLPSLNGYGQLEGTLSSNSDDGKQHVDTDTAAESFVRDGLSKVMKITNICDSERLTDCGLPDRITPLNGDTAINLSDIKTLLEFNSYIIATISHQNHHFSHEQLNTKAAAFETVNGESILVYYNPNCEPDLNEGTKGEWHTIHSKMCANFVYDLNGKKGPNTVGKDMGFITALYSTDPVIVSPSLNFVSFSDSLDFDEASAKCRELNDGMRLPSIHELMSIFYNRQFFNAPNAQYWSSTSYSPDRFWVQDILNGVRTHFSRSYTVEARKALCIKR